MPLKSIFKKPVDRPIEGVIKADDEAGFRLEIEEYVLTNEVSKRLERFLEAYNSYQGANGVWVSGFFGSGKSHLLKMLALLLENREIDGVPALDLFLPKCDDNEILRGDLKRSGAIPSKSILFNIDQKADVISKTQVDALLAVFVKVFDEMCGYYGKQGHIAQFERDLDGRGLYEDFKTAYEALAGRPWRQGREQALLESNNIANAYARATGEDESAAAGILDKYRSQHHVSIEDFADQVKAYVDGRSPDFRLNFFIDEVGQYIADNVKLMTNLQTIAESLATKCRGRAWIVVTSQNDMSLVLGEMSSRQTHDFSKIMARFATKMLLTSTNVAEVIQERLLAKTETGAKEVAELYQRECNHFGTLFGFTEGSRSYRIYRDEEEFIRTYPFAPYQFELFQAAIEALSRHNAFEGKHSSVGERSMLGVFQQVAVKISDYEIGQLASFDLMFEGIQTALKAQTQKAILAAQRQLGNVFAVKLLKTLFIVKYVKEFKSSLRNLCVLMLDDFDRDLAELRKKVEEAVHVLEQETYIQRNGEYFEYLTDEEKDVEQEIKNTEVETADVASELEKIIFDHVIKNKKIRYDENKQDYAFSKKLDDRLHGREHELTIHVITPFYENAGNEFLLQSQTMGRDELLVVLPEDDRLLRDALMYKRTEKYIRQNISVTQQDAIKQILMAKGFRNTELYAELQQHIRKLLSEAKLFVAGQPTEIRGEDPQARIVRAFHELISRVYPNLRMLRGIGYSENDIAKCLKGPEGGLFKNDAAAMAESELDMLAVIQRNSRGGVRTTIKSILENFERKPYGWPYSAVLCTLAKICGRGKVEVRNDGNLLEEEDLERALRNTHGHGNVVVEPQVEFTASQVRGLKEFYEDFFDAPPPAGEGKALGKETGIAFRKMKTALDILAAKTDRYPFLTALAPVLEKLGEHSDKPYTWHLTELLREEDSLLDMKENIVDPIRKFMNGAQKEIFDNARKFAQAQETNFAYINELDSGKGEVKEPETGVPTPEDLARALADPECFKGGCMKRVKTLVDTLEGKITAKIAAEISRARDTVDGLRKRLCSMEEFTALPPEKQERITRPFEEFAETIERQRLIAVIRESLRRFETKTYPNLLSKMTGWAQPVPPPPSVGTDVSQPPKDGSDTVGKPSEASEPRVEFVPIGAVRVSFDKVWLADESEVDRYLDRMREALLAEIRGGKRIQI